MKSLTIYLDEEDFEKVKRIAKEEKMSVSQWYRKLTQYDFDLRNQKKEEPILKFSGLPEYF